MPCSVGGGTIWFGGLAGEFRAVGDPGLGDRRTRGRIERIGLRAHRPGGTGILDERAHGASLLQVDVLSAGSVNRARTFFGAPVGGLPPPTPSP